MDIDVLIEKYLDGSIAPDELETLFSVLKKDKKLLTDFVMDVHLDNALDFHFKNNSIEFPSDANVIELSDEDLKDIAAAGNPPVEPQDTDDE